MSEVKQFIGVDISKDSFNVYGCDIGHKKFSNDKKGFKRLMKLVGEGDCCVMEATGAYHQRLACHLFEAGVMVSVVNPLVIKRYVQMKLKHTKTDKSDAKMISLYADDNSVELWEAAPAYIDECRILHGMVTLLSKQSAQLQHKKHYYEAIGKKKGNHMKSLNAILKRNEKEISKLESEIESIIKDHDPELYSCLQSIPGIGKKTAMFLIVMTRGMTGFETASQLISYFGQAPTEKSSGSSVRGSARISKAGNPNMRRLLFLCSFSAQRHNPQCRAMHARLVAKGKSEKLALIAIANKLLRQAFAISQSRIPYDPQYKSYRHAA